MLRLGMVFFCVCLATMSAGDHGKGKGKGRGNGHHDAPAAVSVRFGADDAHYIQRYYRGRRLPPGLQKKVARGGALPPGWQKKMRPFPVELDAHLPPPCGYCGRGVVEGYAVVYDKRTAIILDVVQLAGDILR